MGLLSDLHPPFKDVEFIHRHSGLVDYTNPFVFICHRDFSNTGQLQASSHQAFMG